MYKHILKPILFSFNPETAHNMTFAGIKFLRYIPFAVSILRGLYKKDTPSLEKEVFGIHFPNPVGLAGGLDKNGEFYNDMANFGFGFVEIGSLTPQPQDGNPKPRCFRVPGDKALINRFGINNKGVKNAVEHLKKVRPEVIVAANISKNTTSVNEDAAKDYESAFALLYDFVDMFVVNISCPNVVGLTALQDMNFLSDIIDRLLSLRMYYDEYRPILLKVSPDLSHEQLDEIIDKLAGKLGKYYKENCLVDQEFVKDNSLTVGKYTEATAKKLGGSIEIKKFIRFEKGVLRTQSVHKARPFRL